MFRGVVSQIINSSIFAEKNTKIIKIKTDCLFYEFFVCLVENKELHNKVPRNQNGKTN